MKQIAALLLFSVLGVLSAPGSTLPIYINNSPVHITTQPQVPPQIDATIFVNRSEFEINDIYFTGLPYQTFSTRVFTNGSGGIMSGDLGYRFEFSSGNTRAPMDTFWNQGSISGDTFLLISATNITSTGPLNSTAQGLIRLTGKNINLRGNGIQATGIGSGFSGLPGFSGSGGNVNSTNYFDPTAVTDNYWAVGTNNVLTGAGNPFSLRGGNFNLSSFFGPFAPQHKVTTASFGASTAGFSIQNAGAFAFTNQISPTSSVVQVVFVPTNSFFDSNISVRVFFSPDADDGADAVVEFSYPEFDVVNQSFFTNYLYFTDQTAFSTNILLAKNLSANTYRPNSYDLTRSTSPSFFGGSGGNTPYDPALLYNTTLASNSVPITYVAYSAEISPIVLLNGSGRNIYATTDPTNYPGRIEISGDTVNLDQAKIRAESTVMIKVNDLASNKVAKISAPYENLDLRTSQPQMVISNFAPTVVQRLSGQISAWSALWNNTQITPGGTNQIQYHVLMLNHSLASTLPVVFNELALHAPHLVIADPLSVRKSMLLDSRSMEVTGGLTLPAGVNWDNSNIVELYSFTNRGVINVSQTAFVGTDRGNPYDNYVNQGTNTASSHQIRTVNFDDSGCLIASAGVLTLEANTASIKGPRLLTNVAFVPITNFFSPFSNFFGFQRTTNIIGAKLQANSDIQITAGDLTFSNAFLQSGRSGGALFLSVSGNLTDAGPQAVSYWNVGGGFNLQTQPAHGDLLGTYVRTTIPASTEVFHTWSAEDRGATSAGFVSNSALGKLTIDAGDFSVIHFAAPNPGTHKALYVDYLELLNFATNFNQRFAIDPSLTIYFANANVEASKVDGAANGRFRWVKTFTGPLSSSIYTYSITNLDGEVIVKNYTFNTAVVTARDPDDDRDGVVNSNDPTPIYTDLSTGLKILTTKAQPPQILIRWNALPGSTNRIEYRTSFSDPTWTVLTNLVPVGPFTGPMTVRDFILPATTGTVQRVYRVVVIPPP